MVEENALKILLPQRVDFSWLEPQPRDPTRIAFGQKDIAVGRPGNAVRAIENRPAAAKPLALGADLLQARHHVADIGAALIIAPDCDGPVEPAAGFEVLALAVEDLHAVRAAVDHDDTAVRKVQIACGQPN